MKAIWRWALAGWVLLALLMAVALVLLVWVGFPEMCSAIEIDGHRVDLVQWRTDHTGLVLLGLGILALVLAVVVPTVALMSLVVPVGGFVLALVVALAALAIVLAPIGLLVWWLWKAPLKKARMPSP